MSQGTKTIVEPDTIIRGDFAKVKIGKHCILRQLFLKSPLYSDFYRKYRAVTFENFCQPRGSHSPILQEDQGQRAGACVFFLAVRSFSLAVRGCHPDRRRRCFTALSAHLLPCIHILERVCVCVCVCVCVRARARTRTRVRVYIVTASALSPLHLPASLEPLLLIPKPYCLLSTIPTLCPKPTL